MKKILLMIVGVVLAVPFFVSAQVAQLSDQFTEAQNQCLDLQYNMGYRSRDARTNGEVSDLQDFLISSGYLSGSPTGYLGLMTVAAIKKFQLAAGIGGPTTAGYGGVGPKSRAKIKAITCGSVATAPTTTSTPLTTTTTTATVAGCTSNVGFSPTTGASCTPSTTVATTTSSPAKVIPAINIIQPITSMVAGSIISVAWDQNYSTQIVTASLRNSQNGTLYFSGKIASGLSGRNYVALPAEAGNVPSGQYTLEICGLKTYVVPGEPNSVCASTQFDVTASSSSVLTPIIKVTDTPVLKLGYDTANKEASLTASYSVSITASSASDFKLYKSGVFDSITNAFLVTINNLQGTNSTSVNPTYYQTYGSAVDNVTYWTIPAGKTASFSLTANLPSPKVLFAGSYNATVSLYKPAGGVDITSGIVNSTTNTVAIIGETSPYITSAVQPTSFGEPIDQIQIKGVRFGTPASQNIIAFNGMKFTPEISASDVGPILQFSPSKYGAAAGGIYTVQVLTKEGGSNVISVKINPTVTVVTTATTTATTAVPQISEIYTNVPVITTVPTFTIKGVRFSATTNTVSANGVTKILPSDREMGPTGTIVMYIKFNPVDFGITTTGVYPVTVTTADGTSNSMSLTVVVPVATTTIAIVAPSVEFIGTPTLALQYSSVNGNEELAGKAVVKISAGSAPINIGYNTSNSQVGQILLFNNGNRVGSNGTIYSAVGTPVCVPTATAGCLIPANSSMTFNITNTAPTKELFAGTYFLAPTGFTYFDLNNVQQIIETTAYKGVSTSNSVTIVGETSPYINSIIADPLTGVITITGVRFTSTNNKVYVPGGVGVLLPATALGKTISSCTSGFLIRCTYNFVPNGLWVISVKPSVLGITSPAITPLQVSTGEGASNVFSVDVKIIASTSTSNQLASVADSLYTEPLPVAVPTWSYNWTRNLEVNSPYVDDIVALQIALTKEGVYTGDATGGFYTQTYLAVKALQAKYGIEATGFVGPETRTKLNTLY